MVKTLPVNVLYNRNYRKCANGGITEREEILYLVDVEGAWFSVPEDDPRLVRIERIGCVDFPHIYVTPVNPGDTEGKVGPMMGGSFVYTSDSRFPAEYPLPVHDRYETQDLYDAMCD